MPMTYTIDEDRGVILTKATGRLTDDELLAHKRRLMEDPRFQPGMRELSDIRAVDELAVTPEGIMRSVRFDSDHSGDLKRHALALLVSDDLVFGMARMYEMRTEGNTGGVEVFRTEAEALSWLEGEGRGPA